MATGTVTTHPTYDWTDRTDSGVTPTTIIGDTVRINDDAVGRSFVWCHVDAVTGIPAGATITQIDVTLNVVQSSATSASPGVHQSPSVNFATESAVLAGGIPFPGLGGFGAGGVGNLPFDTSAHEIIYDASYTFGGIPDPQAWVDAIGAPDPLAMLITAQVVADGEYLEYDSPWTFTIHWENADLPCDTWVDQDLSAATFENPAGDQFGQYVDGVITGLDGNFPQFTFSFDLDPLKRYRVKVTFDPLSAHDGDGDPGTSDRFVLLKTLLPGDEVSGGDSVQIGDGFSNTADEVTLTIGPGIGNWDDPDFGVPQGYTRLLFQTSASGAVSAISIRKVCKTHAPPLRHYPRNDGLGASTTRRLWPIPNTVQASNRRGPSAIL